MKYILGFSLLVAFSTGCSSIKNTAKLNYDDAYFTPSDMDKGGIYGRTNPNLFAQANVQPARSTRSYGQSYNDRLRNFGSGYMMPGYSPMGMYSPQTAALMYMYPSYPYSFYTIGNPGYYGYNPYMMPYGYDPYYSSYGYGYGYYNPQWCYWNQYYSPYSRNYWSSNTGSGSGGSTWRGPSGTYSGAGPRSSYNTAMPANAQSKRTGYSNSGSSGSGSTYYRPSSTNSGSSGSASGPTYSRPSSSGATQSSGGSQGGTTGRRR